MSVVGTATRGAPLASPAVLGSVVMSRSSAVVAVVMSCSMGPLCVVTGSRVKTPDTLTIDEPAFLPARVQARKLDRERVERLHYVA